MVVAKLVDPMDNKTAAEREGLDEGGLDEGLLDGLEEGRMRASDEGCKTAASKAIAAEILGTG